jgi:hypothetical protein
LPEIVAPLGDDETVFLINRVREFAWFTERQGALLAFSETALPSANATVELMQLKNELHTDYLIIDDYTTTRWQTLVFLLHQSMHQGDVMLLDTSIISDQSGDSSFGPAPSLTLVAENEPNEFGRFCRIFSFNQRYFSMSQSISVLDTGWTATNNGGILNQSGRAQIVIGSESSQTILHNEFNLNLILETGFILIYVEETDAIVDSIEIVSGSDNSLELANRIGNGLFIYYHGELTINDIRITVMGEAGTSILVDSLSCWTGS